MAKSVILSYGLANASAGGSQASLPGTSVSYTVTEANRQGIFREAGTVSNLFANISANTLTVSSILTFRLNTANSALTLTVPSATTGIFEDTSNTVTVADGDLYNLRAVQAAGSGTAGYIISGFQFEPNAAGDTVSYASTVVGVNLSTDSATRYYHMSQISTQTVEALAESKVSDSYTVSHLSVYVSANARTTDTTYRIRINNANGNQSVTYTSGQTGRKSDTSNTDSIASGDVINYSVTTSTGGGNILLQTLHCRIKNTTANKFLLQGGHQSSVSTNTTTYRAVVGSTGGQSTESFTHFRPRFNLTLKNFRTYVSTNTFTTLDSTFTVRKNSANTAIVVTYAAAQTGWKEDTTNTADFTSGTDTMNIKITTPNQAGSLNVYGTCIEGYTASAEDFIPRIIFMG